MSSAALSKAFFLLLEEQRDRSDAWLAEHADERRGEAHRRHESLADFVDDLFWEVVPRALTLEENQP